MKYLFILLQISCCGFAQTQRFTTAMAHSHNDYEQPKPFYLAYLHKFGSVEADVFLADSGTVLYVAHTAGELAHTRRTLDSLYLQPLACAIRSNSGWAYADTTQKLQLMIDIKTDAVATLKKLIGEIRRYPEIINCSGVIITISGNRPNPESFNDYPSFIYFDGLPEIHYSAAQLTRITMISSSFKSFSNWSGEGRMPAQDSLKIAALISSARGMHKRVRLWAAPDTPQAWRTLLRLGVGFINTDHISELSKFRF